MHKKWILLSALVLCVFLSACETAKGFKKDARNTWDHLKNADEWIKENLW